MNDEDKLKDKVQKPKMKDVTKEPRKYQLKQHTIEAMQFTHKNVPEIGKWLATKGCKLIADSGIRNRYVYIVIMYNKSKTNHHYTLELNSYITYIDDMVMPMSRLQLLNNYEEILN